jgi:hypothetical protein
MKQYVICKDEAERAELLKAIEETGMTWEMGQKATEYKTTSLTIAFLGPDGGITTGASSAIKQTTIPRFLLGLKIEMLKRERRALPKLGEEVPIMAGGPEPYPPTATCFEPGKWYQCKPEYIRTVFTEEWDHAYSGKPYQCLSAHNEWMELNGIAGGEWHYEYEEFFVVPAQKLGEEVKA